MSTRNERLRDELEDAAFALLMDSVACEEGGRLIEENERLRDEPDAAVPEALDEACMETICRTLAKKRRKGAKVSVTQILSRAAVVVIVLIALFMVAYAAFPDFRAETLNVLIRNSNVASRLNLETADEDILQGNVENLRLMGYMLPDIGTGFSIVDKGEDRLSAWVTFSNEDTGEMLDIRISKISVKYVDTEDAEVEDVLIHGFHGVMTEEDKNTKIYWVDTDNNYYIEITGINVSNRWMLELANNIIYVG